MQDPQFIRLSVFIGVLLACGLWEWRAPRKALTQSKAVRWLNNLTLVAFNSVVLSLMLPTLAFGVALYALEYQFGVMHWLEVPTWLNVVLSVLLLDLAIYVQHRLFHRIPLLWRLHRMHHADQDIDVTTGARFHPLEIFLSMLIKMALVLGLGVSPIAVVVFEVLLNASAMFNHSNAKLRLDWDRKLRHFIVTPDMHRVHHSVIPRETHSNFGFFLSIWDRWFGTYIDQPALGHDQVKIGLPIFNQAREQWLDKMLSQPFRRPKT